MELRRMCKHYYAFNYIIPFHHWERLSHIMPYRMVINTEYAEDFT